MSGPLCGDWGGKVHAGTVLERECRRLAGWGTRRKGWGRCRTHRMPSASVGPTHLLCPIVPSMAYDQGRLFETWANSTPNGSTLHLLPDSYNFDSGFTLGSIESPALGKTIQANVDGNRVTEIRQPSAGTLHRVLIRLARGSDHVTIRGRGASGKLRLVGANQGRIYSRSRESQHGIRLENVSNVLIEYVDISEIYGDWISFTISPGSGSTEAPTQFVTVRHCDFTANGRYGLTFLHCQDLEIYGCTFTAAEWSHLDIEPDFNSQVNRRVKLISNVFGSMDHSLFVAKTGGDAGHGDDWLFRNNIMTERGGAGRYVVWTSAGNTANSPLPEDIALTPPEHWGRVWKAGSWGTSGYTPGSVGTGYYHASYVPGTPLGWRFKRRWVFEENEFIGSTMTRVLDMNGLVDSVVRKNIIRLDDRNVNSRPQPIFTLQRCHNVLLTQNLIERSAKAVYDEAAPFLNDQSTGIVYAADNQFMPRGFPTPPGFHTPYTGLRVQ